MTSRFWWQVIFTIFVFFRLAVVHAADTTSVYVHYRSPNLVYIDVKAPAGTEVIKFSPVNGVTRDAIWKVTSGGMLDGDTLNLQGGSSAVLVMDVARRPQVQDRHYAPFFNASNDGAIVLNSLFTTLSKTNVAYEKLASTSCSSLDIRPNWAVSADGSGYAVLGNLKCLKIRAGVIVYDPTASHELIKKIHSSADQIVSYYNTMLRTQKRINVLAYVTNDSGEYFHGDDLGDGLVVGFSKSLSLDTWNTYSEFGLTQFIAHEIFHQWNAEVSYRENSGVLLNEGGAEDAAYFYSASHGLPGTPALAEFILGRSNQCILEVGINMTIRGILGSGNLNRVPYDCGAVYTLARMPSNGALISTEYFDAWRAVLRLANTSKSLVSVNEFGLGADTDELLSTYNVAGAIAQRFELNNLHFSVTKDASSDENHSLFLDVAKFLMNMDCNGNVGFWDGPNSLTIDPQVKTCKALSHLTSISKIAGYGMNDNAVHLVADMNHLCERGEQVRITGNDGKEANLPCRAEIHLFEGFLKSE